MPQHFQVRKINVRGNLLVNIIEKHDMKIVNTSFQKMKVESGLNETYVSINTESDFIASHKEDSYNLSVINS